MAKNWLPDSQNVTPKLDYGTPSNEFSKYTKHFYLRQNKTKKKVTDILMGHVSLESGACGIFIGMTEQKYL